MMKFDTDMMEWLQNNDFSQSPGCSESTWETVWDHTDGHGFITFRIMAHDTGFWVIVEQQGRHDYGVNLGTCKTFDEVKEVFGILSKMKWRLDAG